MRHLAKLCQKNSKGSALVFIGVMLPVPNATSNKDPNATVTVLTTFRAHDTIKVFSQKTVSMTMMRVLGIATKSIDATATAQVGPAGSAYGILPWAINDDSFASYGYNATVTFGAGQRRRPVQLREHHAARRPDLRQRHRQRGNFRDPVEP